MKSLFTVFLAILITTGCSTQPEGAYPNVVSLNDTPVGSRLFEIKGIDSSEAIAVEINGIYQKATKNGPLK
ncbi:hypothetical protein [Saccharibacillus qingshengii]|uniref:hypothetical protein n=1 Tax=Saccharibacillus qingshengii TaxID=1763540 RepID=UPI001556D5F4|nr:hypothetical protein [Saccharibacillus qingshengii]